MVVKATVPLGASAVKIGNTRKEVKQLERDGTHSDSCDKVQGKHKNAANVGVYYSPSYQ